MPNYRGAESARRIVAQLFDLDLFTVIRKFGCASTWSRGENVCPVDGELRLENLLEMQSFG
jgi:hypothetical protein